MKTISYLILAITLGLSACSTSRQTSQGNSDDMYYSLKDAKADRNYAPTNVKNNANTNFNSGRVDDYSTNQSEKVSQEVPQNTSESIRNSENYQNSENYELADQTTSSKDGNTYVTNNYNGSNDFYDDNYSARLRRFYSPGYSFGYNDPFYTGFYDPFFNPGFNISIGYSNGWGGGFYDPFFGNNPYGWGGGMGWGRNNGFGWGNNFGCNNGFGWGGNRWNNGWGGNGWNNGYNNGYWNGYNDGFNNGFFGNNNGGGFYNRGVNNSPRPNRSSNNGVNGRRIAAVTAPVGNIAGRPSVSRPAVERSLERTPVINSGRPAVTNPNSPNRPSRILENGSKPTIINRDPIIRQPTNEGTRPTIDREPIRPNMNEGTRPTIDREPIRPNMNEGTRPTIDRQPTRQNMNEGTRPMINREPTNRPSSRSNSTYPQRRSSGKSNEANPNATVRPSSRDNNNGTVRDQRQNMERSNQIQPSRSNSFENSRSFDRPSPNSGGGNSGSGGGNRRGR